MMKLRRFASILILAVAIVFAVGCTPDVGTVDVKIMDVTDVTATTAVFHAKASASGKAKVTERGFSYDIDEPAYGTKITCGSGTGEFSATATGLEPATEYKVGAYVYDGNGEIVGTRFVKFTTLGK